MELPNWRCPTRPPNLGHPRTKLDSIHLEQQCSAVETQRLTHLHVHAHVGALVDGVVTDAADEQLAAGVHVLVAPQVRTHAELGAALVTAKRLLSCKHVSDL